MKKNSKHNKPMVIKPEDYKALGFSTYQQTKGMAYQPSPRDLKKRERKQAKQDLRKGDYE